MSTPPLIYFDLFAIIVFEDFRLKELQSQRQRGNKSGRLLLFTCLSYLLLRVLVSFTSWSLKARLAKYSFSFQFLRHIKHSNILVRFEPLIVILMRTQLCLNVMQCSLVHKYELSPVSHSTWSWKLGES
jgi:hypothetical protein